MVTLERSENEQHSLNDLVELVHFLRSKDGCPWDQVQTHNSIRRNFIEEVYEACEAIDLDNKSLLCEELGDVLLQVLFHTDIERELGNFDIDDVANEEYKKMVFRHPHLFDKSNEESKGLNWEQIKQIEKSQESTFDSVNSIAKSLPSLWRAEKIQKKASLGGFSYNNDNLIDIDDNPQDAIGDMLFLLVALARKYNIDPENALNLSCNRFIDRLKKAEESDDRDKDIYPCIKS